MPDICLIRAPSNLGLRPLHPGHVPGTWRAPQALSEAGLVEMLAPSRVVDLDRPAPAFDGCLLQRKVGGSLVREQARQLVGQLAKLLGGDVVFAKRADFDVSIQTRTRHSIESIRLTSYSSFCHRPA